MLLDQDAQAPIQPGVELIWMGCPKLLSTTCFSASLRSKEIPPFLFWSCCLFLSSSSFLQRSCRFRRSSKEMSRVKSKIKVCLSIFLCWAIFHRDNNSWHAICSQKKIPLATYLQIEVFPTWYLLRVYGWDICLLHLDNKNKTAIVSSSCHEVMTSYSLERQECIWETFKPV